MIFHILDCTILNSCAVVSRVMRTGYEKWENVTDNEEKVYLDGMSGSYAFVHYLCNM